MPKKSKLHYTACRRKIMKITTDLHSRLLSRIARHLNCSNSMALAVSLDYIAGIQSQTQAADIKQFHEKEPATRIQVLFTPDQLDRLLAVLEESQLTYSAFAKRVIEQMEAKLPKLNKKHKAIARFRNI